MGRQPNASKKRRQSARGRVLGGRAAMRARGPEKKEEATPKEEAENDDEPMASAAGDGPTTTNVSNNIERFYTNIDHIPFSPVFRPTEEEFADPIAYVAKIRAEAEPYGVVKIVPPASFRPPFVIDSEKFLFAAREQALGDLDAAIRERSHFVDQLDKFWTMQCRSFDREIRIDAQKSVDYFRFHKVLEEAGGGAQVSARKGGWSQIARAFRVSEKLRNKAAAQLKQHWHDYLQPFLDAREEWFEQKEAAEAKSSAAAASATPVSTTAAKDQHGGKKTEENATGRMSGRMESRMMAGASATRKNAVAMPEKRDKTTDRAAPYVCMQCGRDDNDNYLLVCSECDRNSCHIYCCRPKFSSVPNGQWHCVECVHRAVDQLAHQYGFITPDRASSLADFGAYADDFKRKYFGVNDVAEVSTRDVECAFWRTVGDSARQHNPQRPPVVVRYGADLLTSQKGSGFPRKDDSNLASIPGAAHYATHPWNLNNMPVLADSVLSHMSANISGMMVPWVYVGMCFSTFCWHVEDHWTYSINYNHRGETKVWYGVGASEASNFETVMRRLAPGLFRASKGLLHEMITTANPALLRHHGVRVYTVHQNEGDFVITFPRAYHAGFNAGFNIAEAVNFAPTDWLKMGRLCVANYASVGRPCVFAHDELVMKMVDARARLPISQAIAAFEELAQIVARESQQRTVVARRGVLAASRRIFDKTEDDARSCVHCKTTLYMSAVECSHGRLACLEHFDALCGLCTPRATKRVTLRFRFSLDELAEVTEDLKRRTTAYFGWQKRVNETLMDEEEQRKPTLDELQRLLEEARSQKWPHTPLHVRLAAIVRSCDVLVQAADALCTGRPRTRHTTRAQAPDRRASITDLEELMVKLDQQPATMEATKTKLARLKTALDTWATDVRSEIQRQGKEPRAPHEKRLEELLKLQDRAHEFALRTEPMEELATEIGRVQWLQRAAELMDAAANYEDDQDEGEEEDKDVIFVAHENAWTAERVVALLAQADTLGRSSSSSERGAQQEVAQTARLVRELLDQALECDARAARMLVDGADMDHLMQLWQPKEDGAPSLRRASWFTSAALATLRREVKLCGSIKRTLHSGRASTLARLQEAEQTASQSVLLSRDNDDRKRRQDKIARLERFVDRVGTLFRRSPAYYGLFDVLVGRADLGDLIANRAQPLYLLQQTASTSKTYREDWAPIQKFETIDELRAHAGKLDQELVPRMRALRQLNTDRELHETCPCGDDWDRPTLRCLLCQAAYHGSCASWDAAIHSRLPVGRFLCVRCTRSRRPALDDVQAALNQAPADALETELCRLLVERARSATRSALGVLAELTATTSSTPDQLQRLEEAAVRVLAAETVDPDIWRRILAAIDHRMGAPTEAEKLVWQEWRKNPAKPKAVLFGATVRRSEIAKTEQQQQQQQQDDTAPTQTETIDRTKRVPDSTPSPQKKKRSSGEAAASKRTTSKRRRADNRRRRKNSLSEEDEDDDGEDGNSLECKALHCFLPCADRICWVECCSCAQWYHVVCVGLTKARAAHEDFYCFRCREQGGVSLRRFKDSEESHSSSSDSSDHHNPQEEDRKLKKEADDEMKTEQDVAGHKDALTQTHSQS